MGIGVSVRAVRAKKGLFAKYRKPGDLVGVVEDWCMKDDSAEVLVQGRGPNREDKDCLFPSPYPAGESLEVVADTSGLHFTTKTSTIGPGYHDFVVRFLERMARDLDLQLRAEGETDNLNYFERRDFEALRREMLRQLGAIAARILNLASNEDYTSLAIHLSTDRSFESLGMGITPMGPRNRDWFVETAKSPMHGVDIWPWYNQGKTAEYHRDLAIALMWTEVPWRVPLDAEESGLLACVLDNIHRAHDLDATLQYPWREWAELLALANDTTGIANVVQSRADAMTSAETPIGYRRHPVYYNGGPGGWRIQVPGHMWHGVDEEGNWVAGDDRTRVELSALSWSVKTASLDHLAYVLETRELEFKDGARSGIAGYFPEDDALVLRGGMLQGSSLAIVTVTAPPDANRETLLPIWRSLMNPSSSS